MAVAREWKQLTVGQLRDFLAQFGSDVEVPVYLKAEDRLNTVEVFAEDPGEPGYPDYPMIVVGWGDES
jgi:hypothetical protein